MPRRRLRRPRRHVRRRRTHRRRRGRRGAIPKGFPSNRVVSVRYCETFLLNPLAAGVVVNTVFRANSPFDPNVSSSSGRDALVIDQWSTFYSRYCVIGSKISCRFSRTQTSANANSIVGIYLDNQTAIPTTTNVTGLIEQGFAHYKELIGAQTGYLVPMVRNHYSAKRFFNLQSIKDNQLWLGGEMSSSQPPTTGDAFFHVFAGVNIPGGSAGGPIECLVTISYLVLMSDPNTIPV